MALHRLNGGRTEVSRASTYLGHIQAREVTGHGQDVGDSLAQRCGTYFEHIQAVVQVLAETAVGYRRLQIHMSGGQYPHINLYGVLPTHALYLLFLEKSQQIGLQLHGQVADLVEEQGAAVGSLDPADLALMGAGEGALFMAEQLRLNQLLGNGAAVDRDEGPGSPQGLTVQGLGDQLFAGPAFTADQYRCVGGRDACDETLQMARLLAVAEDELLRPRTAAHVSRTQVAMPQARPRAISTREWSKGRV